MDFYAGNLKSLKKHHPYLLARLESKTDTTGLPAVEDVVARSGVPTLKINGRFLHSVYDPAREAKEIISAQKLGANNNVVVFGFGLGYHLAEMVRNGNSPAMLVVVEPDIAVFKAALRLRDLSAIFEKTLRIFLDEEPLAVYTYLSDRSLKLMSSDIALFEFAPAVALHPQYYQQTSRQVRDAIRTGAATVKTMNVAASFFLLNPARNLVDAVFSPGIRTLFGRFKGIPAIIVSAGPSLDKNIDRLRAAGGKALILATDTALKIMQDHGLKPDLVFSADFKPKSKLHFQEIKEHDVPLVFSLEAAPESLATYRGARFAACSKKPFPFLLNSILRQKGMINTGMSVAHFAFSAAEKFGCDPIILIRQGLSFPGRVPHARGTTSRVHIDEAYKNGGLVKIKSLSDGQEYWTDQPMYIYRCVFEEMIKKTVCRCINATEGGAGVPGAQDLPLDRAIADYCRQEFQIADIVAQARASEPAPDLPGIIKDLKTLTRKMERTVDASTQIIDILREIFRLARQEPPPRETIAELLGRIDKPSRVVKRNEALLRIMHSDLIKHLMQLEREKSVDFKLTAGKDLGAIEDDFKDDLEFQLAVKKSLSRLCACIKEAVQKLEDGDAQQNP